MSSLLEAHEIVEMSEPIKLKNPGIYFLIKNKKIIYVGQSLRPEERIHAHLADKNFDRAAIIHMPEDELDQAEAMYYVKFLPGLNRMLPYSSVLLTWWQLKIKTGLTHYELIKHVKTHNVLPARKGIYWAKDFEELLP